MNSSRKTAGYGLLFIFAFVLISPLSAETLRSFEELFPNLTQSQRRRAFTDLGLKYSFLKDETPMLAPAANSGLNLLNLVMLKKPSHIIEALAVVPYSGIELNRLDAYNALSRIGNIQDYSVPMRGKDVNIFKETTRLESAQKKNSISDPPPSSVLPYTETMYLRFKDAYFGNLFLRGDLTTSPYGITYNMTNFTDVRYLIFTIMKAEKFSAIIYLEPIKEGVLVYSMSGLEIPGFVADRVNLTPNINRRINVLLSWIADGLRRQERAVVAAKK